MPPNQNLRRTPSSVSSTGSGASATNQNSDRTDTLYHIESSSSPLTSTDALHILQSLFGRLPTPLTGEHSSTSLSDGDAAQEQHDAMEEEEELEDEPDLMPPTTTTMQSYSDAVRSPLSFLAPAWPQATSFFQPSAAMRSPTTQQPEDSLSIDGDDSEQDDTGANPARLPGAGPPWYMDMPDAPDLLAALDGDASSADTRSQLDASSSSRPTAVLTREDSDATTTSGFSSTDLAPAPAHVVHVRAPAVPSSSSARPTSAALGSVTRNVDTLLAAMDRRARAMAEMERECSWYSAEDDDQEEEEDDDDDEPEGTGSGRSSRMSMRTATPAGSRSASPFPATPTRRAASPGSPLRAETTPSPDPPEPRPASVRQVVVAAAAHGTHHVVGGEPARHAGWMARPPAWAAARDDGGAARSAARRKRVADMMLNDMRSVASGSGGAGGGRGKPAARVRKIKPVVVRLVGEHGVGIGEACMM